MPTLATSIEHNIGSHSEDNKIGEKTHPNLDEVKSSLLTCDTITLKASPGILSELINKFSKVTWYKINTKTHLFLYSLTMNNFKRIKENYPIYNILKMNKILRNKFNQ
jgi:hypothetical protein